MTVLDSYFDYLNGHLIPSTIHFNGVLSSTSRDLSNGYLVAEIFSRYYPHDISVYSYHNGVSFSSKQKNWSRIQKVRVIKKVKVSKSYYILYPKM